MLNGENIKGNMKHSSVALTSNSRNEVYPEIIYMNGQTFLDARSIYLFLNVQTNFTVWFSRKAELFRFKEGRDFFPKLEKSIGGRPKMNYLVSIRMAQHIGMMENSDKGFEIREYYLALEERLQGKHPFLAKCNQHVVKDKVYYFFRDVMRTLGYKGFGVGWRLRSFPTHFIKTENGYFVTEMYASILAHSKGLLDEKVRAKSLQQEIPFPKN